MNYRINDPNREKPYIDFSMIFIIIFLLCFGLIMVYSTSSYEASMSQKFNNDPAYYLKRQAFATVVGVIFMIVFSILPYRLWDRFSMPAYLGSIVLVFLVLSPLGIEANGARRWLDLGINVQPAEVAKLAIIIFVASLICKMGNGISTRRGVLTIFGLAGFMFLIVWQVTDNLSSAIIIFGIAFVMMLIASPDVKYYIYFIIFGCVGAALMVFIITKMADSATFGFRGQRVLAWLDPEAYAAGKGFQTLQALYAIGSGGIFGKGLGQSIQKQGYLPEAQNDMIFSVICEELGLFGGICILLLFVFLLWRMMIIANNAKDLYGALIVVGVMGHIAIQVILNIAVVTNTIPNTGISLPFISYGGSSVVFLLTEMGLVMNVARGIKF